MVVGLLAALVLAPAYWLLVPARWRRAAVTVASLAALAAYDPRLLPFLLAVSAAVYGLLHGAARPPGARRTAIIAGGLGLLAALFLWNKLAGSGGSALPSQTGLVLLGVSYLVLKAAGALIEAGRGTLGRVTLPDVTAWLAFLPTYPSGPMETYEHFRDQQPVAFDRVRVLGGLERILIGLVKALLLAHYLGVWAAPIAAAPQAHGVLALLGGLYALTLRFYLDFSGFSDIAIGLAAVYGFDIDENFDRPLLRRNLVQLWQHWHMTLTRWLRAYLFLPVSRRLLRRWGGRGDRAAIAAGQLVAMTFCGVWHGVAWNFVVWGLLQALGLIWVGTLARDAGRQLPAGLVAWWRRSRVAHVLSVALTFQFFATTVIFAVTDLSGALRYLGTLAGAALALVR